MHDLSDDLKAMFETRQRLKDEEKWSRAKAMTRKIRKQLQKERLDNDIKHLEEELWFDIKKAKTQFMPTHMKLTNEKGDIIKSNERPDRLADHFEHKQWAIDDNR